MPPPELAAPVRAGLSASRPASLGGWGGGPRARVRLSRPASLQELRYAITGADARQGAVARGLGRSYGDAAQLTGGLVLDATALRRHELDADAGTITVDAGVSVGCLVRELVPAGWILPVVPGTQHVTIGGAIASDVHGKNHLSAWSFGRQVQALGLLRSDGELLTLSPGEPDSQFEATVEGMGLTGFIVWARLGLQRTPSATLAVDTERVTHTVAATVCARPPGLIQYQCVVPRGRETVLARMIERLRPSSVRCFLAVLKLRTGLVSAP
jgi:decaprenylphospho-beta-D-ribofuranose 2-oxidase